MTSELLQEIANKLNNVAQRIVVVNDPDGLFATDAVHNQLQHLIDFPIVVAEGITLRVHYELNVHNDPGAKVCYIRRFSTPLLQDIESASRTINISIAELFPNFVDRPSLAALDFKSLEKLYEKHIQGRVSAERLKTLIKDYCQTEEPINESPIDVLKRIADTPDWTDAAYVESLGKTVKRLFDQRMYDAQAAKLIYDINYDFQHFLHDRYFATLNSSGDPKAVHAVIPYLQSLFGSTDKVAFVVVDGLAWWQWEILRDVLEQEKLLSIPEVKAIFAWLPSITALSRQALFRGAAPIIDYRQSPKEEEKLWIQHWKSNPVLTPVYQHNVMSADDLNTASHRLAIVDVQLDKKMHQSSDYCDLYDLTRNWAFKFARIIARLRQEDFKIVLTSDHGNVLAEGIGTLKPEEKVHLYLDNSRGERFVYFNDKDLWRRFKESHYMIQFFFNPQETWLAIADNASFSSTKKQLITHGGSHFMETVIPLVIF